MGQHPRPQETQQICCQGMGLGSLPPLHCKELTWQRRKTDLLLGSTPHWTYLSKGRALPRTSESMGSLADTEALSAQVTEFSSCRLCSLDRGQRSSHQTQTSVFQSRKQGSFISRWVTSCSQWQEVGAKAQESWENMPFGGACTKRVMSLGVQFRITLWIGCG